MAPSPPYRTQNNAPSGPIFKGHALHTARREPVSKRTALERSRRELSENASFDFGIYSLRSNRALNIAKKGCVLSCVMYGSCSGGGGGWVGEQRS